jgi:hypothetical protein
VTIGQSRKTRREAGLLLPLNIESVMLVFVFMLVFMAATRMGAIVVGPQIVADRATGGTAQACANGRPRRAAEAMADHGATRRT